MSARDRQCFRSEVGRRRRACEFEQLSEKPRKQLPRLLSRYQKCVKQMTHFDTFCLGLELQRQRFISSGKGCAAATGSGCVGIGEFKAAAVEPRDEVYDRALEKRDAFGIDVNSKIVQI